VFGGRALDLARSTRAVMQDRWAVAQPISLNSFAVMMSDPEGVVPYVTPTLALEYADCEIEFITGVLSGVTTGIGTTQVVPVPGVGEDIIQAGVPSATGRVSSMIRSVTSLQGAPPTTILTLYDNLPAQPSAGDQFIIYRRQPGSVRENAYSVVNVDLTVARNAALLGVGGRSLTILSLGGAAWSLALVQGNGQLGPFIPSTYLLVGSLFELDFQDIAVTNAAAPSGTAPLVLYVGQRV
jgi:hypothetical protein